MLYERPVPVPVANISDTEGVMVDSAFIAKQDVYEVDLAAWKKGRKMSDYEKNMDGLCVPNAIAATCGTATSFLVEREADKRGATMYPAELWAFLKETIKVALILHVRGCKNRC